MIYQQCEARLAVTYLRCAKRAKREHNGKHYCNAHHPERVFARQQRRDAAARAEGERKAAEWKAGAPARAEAERQKTLAAACERVGRADYEVRRLIREGFRAPPTFVKPETELAEAREALDALHRQGEGS